VQPVKPSFVFIKAIKIFFCITFATRLGHDIKSPKQSEKEKSGETLGLNGAKVLSYAVMTRQS